MEPTSELYIPQAIDYIINPDKRVIYETDPLTLDIDDTEAVTLINRWITDSRDFFKKHYNLYNRRKKNELYLFGRQIDERESSNQLKIYEARYMDNALYEIEASLKPLAMSRLPDLIVTPGQDTDDSRDTADLLTKAIDSDIKKRKNRIVLGIAFKHHPVYFIGVIKVKWNPDLGEYGDYDFEVVHPDYIDLDQTCKTNDADDMKWISHSLPITVQQVIMQFPKKKQEFFAELNKNGIKIGDDGPSTQALGSEITIKEVWFDWYKKKGQEDEEMPETKEDVVSQPQDNENDSDKYEKLSCVMWKYGDCVLDKMKNPDWDWEGKKDYKIYNPETQIKRDVLPEEMMNTILTGMAPDGLKEEQVYHNYFEMPRKPFFFIGYDQWRKVAYDETTRIEQNLRNQQNLDDQGKRVIDKLKTRTKHIWSKEGGMKASDIEVMDMDNPKLDALVEGDVNKVHASIPPEVPSPQEFQALNDSRQRMYSLAGVTAVRGNIQTDVATTNQIAREADFTRADDLVEDTINAAAEWMSGWVMQFIKLRYTSTHFKKLMGDKGIVLFLKLNQDLVQDGMEVMIKASGTDKLKTQNTALEMAKLKMIDPLQFFRDMGLDDPEGRTEQLMLFNTAPNQYMAQYLKSLGGDAHQLAQNLNNPEAGGQLPPPPEESPNGAVQQPDMGNTAAVPAAPPVGAPVGSPRGL